MRIPARSASDRPSKCELDMQSTSRHCFNPVFRSPDCVTAFQA